MPLTEDQRAELIAALQANSNAAAVARQTGYPHTTVWQLAQAAGIELKAGRRNKGPNRRLTDAQEIEIVKALAADPHIPRQAERFTRSPDTIWKIAKKHGIPLAPRSAGIDPLLRNQVIDSLRITRNASHTADLIPQIGYRTVARIAETAGLRLKLGRPIKRRHH